MYTLAPKEAYINNIATGNDKDLKQIYIDAYKAVKGRRENGKATWTTKDGRSAGEHMDAMTPEELATFRGLIASKKTRWGYASLKLK